MRLRFIVPLVICILLSIGTAGAVWGSTANPSENSFLVSSHFQEQLTHLDEVSNSLYEAAITNNRQVGYLLVQQLERIVDGELKYSSGKRDGWLAIKEDLKVMEQTLVSGRAGSAWVMEAARIKLATDALVRPEHALWLQYESIMLEDLALTEKAWKRQTEDAPVAARAMMNKLQEHAERIEPVIQLLYGSSHSAELNGRILYTNRLLESNTLSLKNKTIVNHSLKAIKDSIIRLYDASERVEAMPTVAPAATANPLSWALFLGAIISLILTYSGWRKYKSNPFGVKPLP